MVTTSKFVGPAIILVTLILLIVIFTKKGKGGGGGGSCNIYYQDHPPCPEYQYCDPSSCTGQDGLGMGTNCQCKKVELECGKSDPSQTPPSYGEYPNCYGGGSKRCCSSSRYCARRN